VSAGWRAALVVIALGLSGCTTTHLTKSVSPDNFERDDAACKSESRVWGLFTIESRYRDCMLARGYRMH